MKSLSKKNLGELGEKIAVDFLKKQGIKIIEKNFRSKFGEIDIIGQIDNTLVFFEVKTRSTLAFGQPYEAVNKTKIKKIKKTIEYFLFKHPKFTNKALRIDVLSLILDKQGKIKDIRHFKNIL